MTTDNLFQTANTVALLGWVLIILSKWIKTEKFVMGIIITMLCITYVVLIFTNFSPRDAASFSTLDGVVKLFDNKTLVLAGWVHYLAFDLATGLFITANARKHNISFWLLLPCLFFTFMLGPVGLLLFLIIRFVKTKSYFADNY